MSERERVAREVFWKLHDGLPQQGPGSDASTQRALSMIPGLPDAPRILDLGCGPGRQSLELARATGGHVTAIDLLTSFLEELDERAKARGLEERIETRCASMLGLDFDDACFDLIWSEGAIYNVGFRTGLAEWRRMVRPGGAVAVTEATWLSDDPPEAARQFWDEAYPAMQDIAANERDVESAGFHLLGTFVIPRDEWWDDYYSIIEERIARLRPQSDEEAWVAALDAEAYEASIVREFGDTFGYVFYVMQRPEAANGTTP